MTEKTNIRIARRQDYRKLRFAFFRLSFAFRSLPSPSFAFCRLPLLSLFLTIASCLLPAASPLYSAEFEVVDRFSVNNYSEFRGSVTVKGSMLDVQNSAQFGSTAKSTFTAVGALNLAPGAALTFTAGAIGDGLIYGQDIAVSTITLDRLNQSGCSPNQIPKWNGTAWSCGTDSGGSGEYVLKAGDAMTGPLTLNGSSLTVVNSLGADRYSLAATTAADRSVYHLFVATTGNVGIGTTNPLTKLEVTGAASGLPATSGTTQANASVRFGNTITNGILDIGRTSASSWLQSTDKTNLAYTDSLLLNPNGGNIGIGTTGPGAKLHVYGGGARMGLSDIALPTSGVEYGLFTVKVATDVNTWAGSIVSYGADGKGLRVYNNGGTNDTAFEVVQVGGSRLIVDGSGNVGIGTTSPSVKLDVVGTTKITNGEADLWLTSTGIGAGTWRILGSLGGTTKLFRIFDSDNNVDRLDITATGNVGIGTTWPNALLELLKNFGANGNANELLRLNARGTASTGFGGSIDFYSSNEASQNDFLAARIASVWEAGDNQFGLRFFTKNAGGLGGATTEKMRITTSGNVGIGTTGPGAKLQVTGGDAAINTQGTGLILKATDGASCFRVTVNNAGTLATASVTCP